ncbi:MAG: TerB family tellurite resistance protein [Deltaproteobacteria bacterium]|nr:TerB family tellurite resistance protein [Deltaproteobacteria bacterium]
MTEINQNDIMIIVKGATQMAQEDTTLHPKEEALLRKIIEVGGLKPEVFNDFSTSVKKEIDIFALVEMLSGEKAKKAFLLGMATMALADGTVDDHEKEFLDELGKELHVGGFKISALTYEKGESMLMHLIEVAEKS